MRSRFAVRTGIFAGIALSLAACGGGDRLLGAANDDGTAADLRTANERVEAESQGSSIFDLFRNDDEPNITVEVNKYIWFAAQDILNFMPIEAADPFSGVIVYGYGAPPGSGRAYRATVYVTDPALDARSLRLALFTRSGPASRETIRAIEDAILTRARERRIADSRL
ncbi:MAG: DUF3576 domain-containing protein [Rhodobacteraceae bacterium]|nr:DUF3576 domain-containing protein [Paracoccaceae bacterium]